jgi:hypothetical protein
MYNLKSLKTSRVQILLDPLSCVTSGKLFIYFLEAGVNIIATRGQREGHADRGLKALSNVNGIQTSSHLGWDVELHCLPCGGRLRTQRNGKEGLMGHGCYKEVISLLSPFYTNP